MRLRPHAFAASNAPAACARSSAQASRPRVLVQPRWTLGKAPQYYPSFRRQWDPPAKVSGKAFRFGIFRGESAPSAADWLLGGKASWMRVIRIMIPPGPRPMPRDREDFGFDAVGHRRAGGCHNIRKNLAYLIEPASNPFRPTLRDGH
jgi:hypothetical protein